MKISIAYFRKITMKAFIAFAFLVLTVNADSDAELWAQFKVK